MEYQPFAYRSKHLISEATAAKNRLMDIIMCLFVTDSTEPSGSNSVERNGVGKEEGKVYNYIGARTAGCVCVSPKLAT